MMITSIIAVFIEGYNDNDDYFYYRCFYLYKTYSSFFYLNTNSGILSLIDAGKCLLEDEDLPSLLRVWMTNHQKI